MGLKKIVTFKLGAEEYGLDIDGVQSIERVQQITRVPNAPAYVRGVINLRGNVTPVIDLRNKLGLGDSVFSHNTRIIISKFDQIELGLLVDQARDVIDVAAELIEETASAGLDSVFFEGVANVNGRLIILLNLEELTAVTVE